MAAQPDAQGLPLAFLGFGEAAQAFLSGSNHLDASMMRGFDIKLLSEDEPVRTDKASDFASFNVLATQSARDALEGASTVLSLVTADQAQAAALTAAESIAPGAFFFDGNSVSPATKRAAAQAIEAAGARYVDVAVMAPVYPLKNRVPLLVSGPHAAEGAARLTQLGFNPTIQEGPVGTASAVKMIRSVMIKGIEALTAECLTAAVAAGVDREVIASLDASDKPQPWSIRGDYNLDRMLVHGERRAAEMREVIATLEQLGVPSLMSRGTANWQAAIGGASIKPPPVGYVAKVSKIREAKIQP